jgi:trans-aconitate 2-methyltransferase
MVVNDVWSPPRYERFKAERSRPFYDLLALVRPVASPAVVDLGCGTAELTADAHRKLGARRTVGVDRSESMLAKGRAALSVPGLELVHGDLAGWLAGATERFDVILSNAALHWVPDHPRLFASMAARLRPHGQLAVQVPVNHEQPPATVAVAIAAEEPFASALEGAHDERPILGLEAYARLLHDLGFGETVVRVQVYTHLLPDRAGVVEWVRGTTLTWYEERLGPELFARFVERYRARLYDTLADERPFVFTFRRLFVWGLRSGA